MDCDKLFLYQNLIKSDGRNRAEPFLFSCLLFCMNKMKYDLSFNSNFIRFCWQCPANKNHLAYLQIFVQNTPYYHNPLKKHSSLTWRTRTLWKMYNWNSPFRKPCFFIRPLYTKQNRIMFNIKKKNCIVRTLLLTSLFNIS